MEKDEWLKVKEFVKSNIGESAHTNWIQPIELKIIKLKMQKMLEQILLVVMNLLKELKAEN